MTQPSQLLRISISSFVMSPQTSHSGQPVKSSLFIAIRPSRLKTHLSKLLQVLLVILLSLLLLL
ncbi:hypothetical protein FRACYDRAFT_268787, partial [Fragilariopsis cylindrus CCMP1102]